MKYVLLILCVVVSFASTASAQSNPAGSEVSMAPAGNSSAADAGSLTFAPSLAGNSARDEFATEPWRDISLLPAQPTANTASPQGVQNVFQTYNWQAYFGYTYVRFFQTPGVSLNTNGFNFGIVYYLRNWVGADGEFVSTFGSQYGDTANFLLGMGGLRFRWSAPRGLEVWAHGLVGGSHYLPQTANGSAGALGYELGGGVDITAHHQRWAYRVAVDVVGTRYFNTYQYSPKASAGIVFKF
jgi:hypothetical protein